MLFAMTAMREFDIFFFKKEKGRYRVYRGSGPSRVLLGEVIRFLPGPWYFFCKNAPQGCFVTGSTRMEAVNAFYKFY